MACPVDSLEVAGPGGGFRWPGRGTGHPGGHGAVDCQGGAGDEGGLVGAEPGRGGAGLRRPADSAISLVVAKAPPPPPSTAPPAPPPTAPHGTATPPTLTSAFARMPRTTTVKGALATGPTMCPARSECCHPTHSSWTAATTMAGAASRDERATLNEHLGTGRPLAEMLAAWLTRASATRRDRAVRAGIGRDRETIRLLLRQARRNLWLPGEKSLERLRARCPKWGVGFAARRPASPGDRRPPS
jgi:hypothetical protein